VTCVAIHGWITWLVTVA